MLAIQTCRSVLRRGSRTRRLRRGGALLLVALCLSAAAAQTPISSVDQFRTAMLRAADAFGVIEPMVPSPVYLLNSARGDAISRLVDARRTMESVRTFFEARKMDDAVRLAGKTIAEMEALDEVLSMAEPDQAAAIEVTAAISRACDACHKVYREGDPQRGFRFKDGIL